MAQNSVATGASRNEAPTVRELALALVERQRDEAIAQARKIHDRRARTIEVLCAGGSLRSLAVEHDVSRQTIVNDVAHIANYGVDLPIPHRRQQRTGQERMPVA